MALTDKQKRFCEEYIVDCNATQAYIRAGYSPKGANKLSARMMAKDGIQRYIQKLMGNKQKDTIMAQDEVLERLTSIARGEKQKKTIMVDGNSLDVEEIPETKEQIKCLELLGKRYGSFEEKLNISGDIGVTIIEDI